MQLFSVSISSVIILKISTTNENILVHVNMKSLIISMNMGFSWENVCWYSLQILSSFQSILLENQFVNGLMLGTITSRRTGKHLSHLLRMKSHLMNIVNQWKRMAHGLDIWNCRQLLLLHIVIYAFTGWALFLTLFVLLALI